MSVFSNFQDIDENPAPTQRFYKRNGRLGFEKNGQPPPLPTAAATSSSILAPPAHQSKPVASPTPPPIHTEPAPKLPAPPPTPLGLPPMSIAAINSSLLEKGVIRPSPASQVNPEALVPVTKQFSTPCTFGAFPQPPLQAHRWTPVPSPSLPVGPSPVHGLPAPLPGVPGRRPQGLSNAPHAPRLMTVPVAPRPTPRHPSDQAQSRPQTRQSSFPGGLEAHLGWGERPTPSYFKLQAEKLRASRAEPKVRLPTLWAGGLSHPPFGLEPPPSSFKPDLEWLLACEPDYDLPAEQWLQLLLSYGIRPFGPELPRGFPPGGYPPRRLPQPRDHTRPITLRGDWQPSPEFLATLRSPSAPTPQPRRNPLPPLRFESRISDRVVVLPPGLPCESFRDLQRCLWVRAPPTPAEIEMIHRRARQDMWGAGVAFNRACGRL